MRSDDRRTVAEVIVICALRAHVNAAVTTSRFHVNMLRRLCYASTYATTTTREKVDMRRIEVMGDTMLQMR